ncbi:transglycosylase SLT domain-containing protein [bacterium]|nr:transglycosylase SLT domain-containing protein [bacterium]MBU1957573.1 transglycosylase SLT domain-containing protein [bacterium]
MKNSKKIVFLTLFCCFIPYLYGQNLSFQEIEAMPNSYAKDYYTWRFLQEESTSKEEALTAYEWTKRKSYKLRKAIQTKIGYTPQENTAETKKDPNNYIIYPSVAANKRKKELKKLYEKIQAQGKYSDVLKVMSSNKPFKMLATMTPKTQCYIFNGVGSKYRKAYFNKPFSKEQLQKLIQEEQFNSSVHKIVTTHALQQSKKSLLLIEENNLSFESNFLLAMNAVEYNENTIAINFLNYAKSKTNSQGHYDQIDFWFYMLTKDESYLQNLIKSHQVNLYTLRARDILKEPYPKVETPDLGFNTVNNFDINNPIDWEHIKIKMLENPEQLDALAEKYNAYETVGIYAYIKEKASKYTIAYYPMPYREAMWGYSRERMAILYAIGRQESRFIPASVSPSYALGMMQIMPFLIKHLAKERKEKLDLNEMFNPYVAVSYANQHMNYLNKWLYHPLFVAYAYNGGIGFTKRTIQSEHMFKEGQYEPYLSMELVDYLESREYAKKVLTNYVIYLNLLGSQTKVSDLLNTLKYPSQTDRFRK